MQFKKETVSEMVKHALSAYPDECCGIVTGNSNDQVVHICENIQNRLHGDDPDNHPRTARTAYAIDRNEANAIISEAVKNSLTVLAFYHSHTDNEAYFSETDIAAQTVFGEPEFPEAVHLVISICNGKFNGTACFVWNRERNDFDRVETGF